MSSIATGNAAQYGDSRKLAARAGLYKYSIAATPWFPWVARQLHFRTGDWVLDIGCGPGWFWAAAGNALPTGLNLTLVDLSPGMVQEAAERCQTLPFGSVRSQQADVAAIPLSDSEFDAIIAMHMLYHVADPAHALAEMHRLLKPGGFAAVTTNGARNMREIYELASICGGSSVDPSAVALGFDKVEHLMRSRFGDVTRLEHPATLRITDPEDVFPALTSYPPGENATDTQKAALRRAISDVFRRGKGVLEARTEVGLFVSRKAIV